MSKKILLILAIMMLTSCSSNATVSNVNKDILLTEKTTQEFSDESISQLEVENILMAGLNAQSAMNKQPWHFSAITNKELLKELKEKFSNDGPEFVRAQNTAQIGDSPLAIVMSSDERSEFDLGLATQNMVAYAELSGYGVKVVSSARFIINNEYKDKLGIPEDMRAVAVILIGKKANGNDTITSATSRKSLSELVTIVD